MKTKINHLLGAVLLLLALTLTLRRAQAAQLPANDDCATAQAVSVGSYSGTTTGANPDYSGYFDFSEPDVWYSFVASEAGTLKIDTCASVLGAGAIDTTLTLLDLTEPCEFSSPFAGNDNCEEPGAPCGAPKSCLTQFVTAGTYLIRVATIGTPGDFKLNISFSPICSHGPTPPIDWVRRFGSLRPHQDFVQAADGDGNYFYVAGSVGGALPGQNDLPESDAFLRKYDALGNEIWTAQFGTSSDKDVVAGVAVDASGVYVVGSVFFYGALPGQSNFGGQDAYLRKYDADGNVVWTRQFGTPLEDRASGVVTDGTSIYVVGFARDPLPGQSDSGAFIRKYDPNGNEVWTRQFVVCSSGAYSNDCFIVEAIAVAVEGTAVYVSGAGFVRKYDINGTYFWTTLMGFFNGLQIRSLAVKEGCGLFVGGSVGEAWMDGAPDPLGGSDAWIRKLDPDTGSWLWTRRFGTTDNDSVNEITIDATGVYVAGTTTGDLLYFLGATGTGEIDAFLAKFDCDGNPVSTSQLGFSTGTSFVTKINGVVRTSAGVAVFGEVEGALPGQPYYGWGDAFVGVYNPSGGELWRRQFGTLFGPAGGDVVGVASDGNVYVTGRSEGVFPGISPIGNGSQAYVRKYAPDGNVIWTRQFGTYYGAQPRSIAVNETGVYVVGQTYGVFSGQVSAGENDAFVAKLDHDGNHIWTRQFGAPFNDDAYGVSAGPSGVWVVGQTQLSLRGPSDALITLFDTNGNLLWTRQFGTWGGAAAKAVASDASGAFVVGYTSDFRQTGFIRRYDTAGNVTWNQSPLFLMDNPSFPIFATAVATDGSAVYFAGGTSLNTAFVRKLDSAGNTLWTSEFGRSDYIDTVGASASTIVVRDGGVFVAGQAYGSLACQANAGWLDGFVGKLNSNSGERLWTVQFGSSEYDYVHGASVDATGIYVVGRTAFGGTLPGQTSNDGHDAFVLRLSDVSANRPPVASLPAPFTVQCSAAVTVAVTLGDPDNDPLTVVWTVDGVPYATHALAAGATSDSITATFGLGPHVIQASVTDGKSDPVTRETTVTVPMFAADAIIWHQPLARNGASEDTDPSAGRTVKYRFKRGSTIPIQIHALNCAGADVTPNANVIGQVTVFGDSNCEGAADANAEPIEFTGVGGGGGVMDKIGEHLKYNLDTTSLPSTTQCYILRVTVTDTSTGEEKFEEVLLQAK